MSLYDGLIVETAPVPELTVKATSENPQDGGSEGPSGWSASMKLMATHLQRLRPSRALQSAQRGRGRGRGAAVGGRSSVRTNAKEPTSLLESVIDLEDDLAGEVKDEYDPMYPNNFDDVVKERDERDRQRRRDEREREREKGKRYRPPSDHNSDSEDEREREERKRKQAQRKGLGAIPPPSSLAVPPPATLKEPKVEEQPDSGKMMLSSLEQLSKTKAPKSKSPFAKPFQGSAIACNIMSRDGWKPGQGLGKFSQGISEALAVEKTSRRGGKIVNIAAEREIEFEEDKKRVQSLAEIMKKPTKVILMQNMVGPGEVDDDLQPEVAEECSKYGEVIKCLIYEIPGAADDEAVRIFVEFTKLDSAIKAVIDLNGRFFGGRTIKAGFFSTERFEKFDLAPEGDS